MKSYVLNSNNTFAQYIATQPIMDLCEEMMRMPGTWVAKGWWGNEGMDLAGIISDSASPEEEWGA